MTLSSGGGTLSVALSGPIAARNRQGNLARSWAPGTEGFPALLRKRWKPGCWFLEANLQTRMQTLQEAREGNSGGI